jgi:hypothetical protein
MIRTFPKVATGALLVAVLGLTPLAAGADSAPTTTQATTTTQVTTTTAKTVSTWATVRISWKAYVSGLRAIDTTYRTARQTARTTYVAAIKVATTPTERQAARAALAVSVAAALDVRVAAIIAAGNPPTPPANFRGSAWVMRFQDANVAFRAAVVSAQSAYATALGTATTNLERATARATFRAAVDAAQDAHVRALASIGSPPRHPGRAL